MQCYKLKFKDPINDVYLLLGAKLSGAGEVENMDTETSIGRSICRLIHGEVYWLHLQIKTSYARVPSRSAPPFSASSFTMFLSEIKTIVQKSLIHPCGSNPCAHFSEARNKYLPCYYLVYPNIF